MVRKATPLSTYEFLSAFHLAVVMGGRTPWSFVQTSQYHRGNSSPRDVWIMGRLYPLLSSRVIMCSECSGCLTIHWMVALLDSMGAASTTTRLSVGQYETMRPLFFDRGMRPRRAALPSM